MTQDVDLLRLSREAPTPTAGRGLQLFSLRDTLFADTRFDIAISAAEPFEIDNNMAKGKLRPELRLTGTGAVPILGGRIYVEPTRVQLPSATLRVRTGTIDFLASNPYVPELEIVAETRLQGYDITVRVSGPYDQPVVELSSVPPLSHEDLLLLILTGRPPGEDVSLRTGEQAAQDVAVFLAKDVVAGWFAGGPSDDESLADRFEIYSGEDITRSGAQTTLVRYRVADAVITDNDALYITGEEDAYDHYNFGVRVLFRFP
jgi:translocation and assembly module TamB